MLLDSAVIAGLIFCFARYNAEGGLPRTFLMLLGVIVATVLVALALPASLGFLIVFVYIGLLAAGLTFVCGTQPRQTGKIIGSFLLFRLCLWGVAALLTTRSG